MQNWRALYAQKELLKRAPKVRKRSLQKSMEDAEPRPQTYSNANTNYKNGADRVMHFLMPFLCIF